MKPSMTMLHVRGDTATVIGYGRLGVKLASALEAKGVDLYNSLDSPNPPTHLQKRIEGTRVGLTNVVGWVSTPGHARGWHAGQYATLFTMWEAQRLPEAYREYLHNFDLIIVPSEQNLELFSRYHDNVKLVYLGVDPAEWHYVPRQAPASEFRFLIGGSGHRKGVDLAVKAFRRVFKTWPKDGPMPTLTLKNPKGEDYHGDRINIVSGHLSDAEEQALYAAHHVYLQPSRGEGFGLQPLQAMAQGMPTILTDAHGHAAFADLGYGLSTTNSTSAYFIYGDAGDWWEPDFDELCGYMAYVYDQWDEAEAKGKHAAEVVADRFTWADTADQYVAAVGMDRLTAPYAGDGSWFTPEAKLYPIAVSREWRADIAGHIYLFKPGNTYYEMADVKRILFEAGILDPSCLEGDADETGLLPAEVARLDAYKAEHEWCDRCGQRLGSGVQRADVILAEMEAARVDQPA